MAEISKITLPSGVTYDIKDATARAAIAGGTTFLGITTTPLTDGATTSVIKIDNENINAVNGGIAIYQNKEFIYSTGDNKWHEIGDTTNLGALAMKDTASASYTPAGSVSQPTFTGTAFSSTGKVTPSGTVSQPTFTGSSSTFTGNFTPAGSISTGAGTANYTPEGSVSTPTITVTPNTVSKYVAASASAGGAATPGTAASCTLPVMTTSVANETLSIGWSAGSFTPNTPTAVTMPSFAQQTIATGIKSASSTQPTFTGTGTELKFSGSQGNVSVTGTPNGTVSTPTFTGDEANVTVSGTPTGSVSKPTFTGTAATITVS